ncbi:MAG TPA: DegT/DnrJ/EryC1/StrS family aminotransferase [Roseiflexaceae bacterium]|nr:DegT/DnrJ/EryC1/StrS family aminotransferase [Roseiflexaceae bacterium]
MPHLAIRGGAPVRTTEYPAWPIWDQREIDAVTDVIRSGRWGGYPEPGPHAAAFANAFAAYQGAKHGICMANGTITMIVALRAAGIQLGDEVIVPAYTFAATAYAPLEAGAVPVIVDIDPNNFCMDPKAVEAAITPRTRAIIPVHVGSLMTDMDAILGIARRHNLVVIEDCAHAHGARWRDRGAGTLGHFGSFSMQSSKLMTSGEGGIVLTDDDAYAEACHSLIDCGRPKDSEHKHYRLGANLRLSELQAALLEVGLTRLPEQTAAREEQAAYLEEALSEIPGVRVLRPDDRMTRRACFQYIFAIEPDEFGGLTNRQVAAALEAEGIPVSPGYEVMNNYRLFRPTPENHPVAKLFPERFEFDKLLFPVALRASEREAVWVDHSVLLGDRAGVDQAVEALRKVRQHADELR